MKNLISIGKKYTIPVLLLAFYTAAANYFFGYFCPSLVLIGLPCPACGMTRAFFLLATGNIRQAAAMNPMVFPVTILGIFYVYFYFRRPGSVEKLYYPLLFILLASFAVFAFRVYTMPGTEPIVFNNKALLLRILRFFVDIKLE